MIDIHTHTKYSDGSISLIELLEEAQEKGLTLLSITDYNTVDAYKELINPEIRNIFKGAILPGVEITTTYNNEIIEVLGYGFDLNKINTILKKITISNEKKHLREYELMKNKYKKLGVKFDLNEITFNPKIESACQQMVTEILKYPENYKYLLYKESWQDNKNYFIRNEIYNPKSPLYIDETEFFPTLEETIEIIHDADGYAFLAHPFIYSPNIKDQITNLVKNYYFDGIECYYPTFTENETNYLLKLCEERNMYISGGSSLHNNVLESNNIKTSNLTINEDIVKPWIKNFISNIKMVTSYYEPDLDAVASSFAFSEYLNKRNRKSEYFIYGTPKKEVQIICDMFDIVLNSAKNIKTNQDIIIVDTNNYDEFRYIHRENIVGIIDHHKKQATQEQFPNARIQIELTGSVATLIAEKFKNKNLIPSRESAILLYYGIISNTINLNANTTTKKDIEMLNWLESLYKEITPNKIEEIFRKKSLIEDSNLRHEMEAEIITSVNDKKLTVAQLEITNLENYLKLNKHNIIDILKEIKEEKQLDHIFINCVDIIEGFNILITIDDDTTTLLEKSFNLSFINNEARTPRLILRKELIDRLINFMSN